MRKKSEESVAELPPEQQAIHARCFHPSGLCTAFAQADIEQSIPERFEQVVQKYPDRVAVKTSTRTLTYAALDCMANKVANAIVECHGDQSGPVGILFDSGCQLIAAILGVWKAGRCVALVDPTFPRTRIAAMLDNSEATLVIADGQNIPLAMETAGNRRLMNIESVEHIDASTTLRRRLDPTAYACIVYTSGSTGEPKAVILNHRNMLHQAGLFVAGYHLCVEDRISLLTAGTSNAVHNALLALVVGATLLPFDVRRSGINRLAEWLAEEKISICMIGSPLFRSLCEAFTGEEMFPGLRLIRLRSEAVYKSDFELYKKHLPKHCILTIGLASSETGLFRNCFFDQDSQIAGDEAPVGYAVADKEVWLQDADGRRLGFNEIGEIVVRSKYISPGYWRRPDLTEAKFKNDPEGGEKRICFTGDLGMMLPDGCLIHKGRADFRVKVRGYRVELAEVEKALLSYPGVREAVVTAAKNKSGESRLVAYFTSRGLRPTVNELRGHLGEKLPNYMSPSVFMALDSMPLTRNGKLDRNALPAADNFRPALSTAYVAPRNPTESRLAGIWADVLCVDCVGVEDNFFDLGGHSLSATRIISRVIKSFQLKLPVNALFQSPTIGDMAAVILQNQRKQATEEDLARILNDLDSLSEAEAEQILARDLQKTP